MPGRVITVVLVVLVDIYIKLTHIYGDGVETRGEESSIYKTHIILAVYI